MAVDIALQLLPYLEEVLRRAIPDESLRLQVFVDELEETVIVTQAGILRSVSHTFYQKRVDGEYIVSLSLPAPFDVIYANLDGTIVPGSEKLYDSRGGDSLLDWVLSLATLVVPNT